MLFLQYYTIAIMSDNRGSEVMLYFTDEVFCRLANQRTQNINDLGAMAVSSVFDLCRNVHLIKYCQE